MLLFVLAHSKLCDGIRRQTVVNKHKVSWRHLHQLFTASSLCPFSQGEEAAVQRWLPHVHAPTRGGGPQPGAQRAAPGHEPSPQSLLHLLLAQHLSHGGSAQRAQQHGGLRQVEESVFELLAHVSDDITAVGRVKERRQRAAGRLWFVPEKLKNTALI